MTFHISPKGVKNTSDTTARFGQGGKVKIGGNFHNFGKVEIDIRANLEVVGDIVNSGDFNVKDYIAERNYQLIEKAIGDLSGEPKILLQETHDALKANDGSRANSRFKTFINYIKNHPELVTSSVQALLSLFGASSA